MNVGTLTISLTARTASLAKAAAGVKAFETGVVASVQRINASISSVGMAFSALTIPIAAIGIGATKMFAEFEFSLAKIEGLVGISHGQTMQWGADVLALAKTVGVSANKMGEALYFVTSAGIRGANTMEVVKASAQASAAGMGESKDIASLLTSAMNAYGEANLSASEAMDILVTAVREGKVEAKDLLQPLGKALPIASNMGVKFNELGAAIGAMTRTGTPARTAGMMITRMLFSIQKPSKDATKTIKSMGGSFEELRKIIATERGGLLKTLLKLKQMTDLFGEEKMARIFPNIRAYLPALDLLGQNLEKNKTIWMAMLEPAGNFKKLLEVTGSTIQKQFAIAVNAAGEALIQLGHTFAQNLIPVINEFAQKMRDFSDWWTGLSRQTQNLIIKITILTGVIGPLLLLFSSLVGVILSIVGAVSSLIGTVIIGGLAKLITLIYSLGKAFLSLKIISGITVAFTAFKNVIISTSLINGIGSLIASLGKLLGAILAFSAGTVIIGILAAIAAMVVLVIANFEQWKLSMPKIMDEIKLQLAKFFTWANEQFAKFFDWLESPEGFNKLGKLFNTIGGFTLQILGADVKNPQEWYRLASQDNKKLAEDLEKKLADPKNYAEGAMTFKETFFDSIDAIKEKVPELLGVLTKKLFGDGEGAGSFPGGGNVDIPTSLRDTLLQFTDTAKNTKGLDKTRAAVVDVFRDISQTATQAKEQVGVFVSTLFDVAKSGSLEGVKATVDSFISSLKRLTTSTDVIDFFETTGQTLMEVRKEWSEIDWDIFGLPEEIEEVIVPLQKLENEIIQLQKLQQNAPLSSEHWQELQKQIEVTKKEIADFKGELGSSDELQKKIDAFGSGGGIGINLLNQKVTVLRKVLSQKIKAPFDENWLAGVKLAGEALDAVTSKLESARVMQQALISSLQSIGTLFGDAFVGAEEGFKNFAKSILSIAGQVVGALLSIALAKEVVDKGLVAGLIIGVVGISAILALMNNTKKQTAAMAMGGVVPSGYPNDSYPAMLTSGETVVPPGKLPEFDRSVSIKLDGEWTIRGKDIYYLMKEQERRVKNTF